jgi:[ribosomal protein S5]-alanine N-acetyltransferase
MSAPATAALDETTLRTARLVLRLAVPEDAERMLVFSRENRAHLATWEPRRAESYYALARCENEIIQAQEQARDGRSLRLLLWSGVDLAGFLNVSSLERGPFQSCRIGYKLGAAFEGQGLMSEALGALVEFLFVEQNFHRIEANYLPDNRRSAALLAKFGFEVSGIERDYLRINGAWRDHCLSSLKNPDWRAPEGG